MRRASAVPHAPRFAFVPWAWTRRGWTPRLPKRVGFLLLAEPDNGSVPHTPAESRWALFRLEAGDGIDAPTAEPVPRPLATLLHSAESYPPAMALAREAVSRDTATPLSRTVFTRRLAWLIRRYLADQRTSGYLLARAVRRQSGYILRGDWYWIVAYDQERDVVYWVSAWCFQVYGDNRSYFDVAPPDLAHLPARPELHVLGPRPRSARPPSR